jgi:thymidine phosphorylase
MLAPSARDPRFHEVVMALAAEMLALGGIDGDPRAALESGAAAERFGAMVAALGGPADLVERPERYLAAAPVRLAVMPERAGYLVQVDARAIGEAVIALGGGRRRIDDMIDPSVGFTEIVPVGAEAGPDRPLAIVHAATQAAAEQGLADFARACIVADERPGAAAVIHAID